MVTAVTTFAPHAWLWNVDTFSDFTLILWSGTEISSTHPHIPIKKARKSYACKCRRPSLEAASRTGPESDLTSPGTTADACPSSATTAAGFMSGEVTNSSGPPGSSSFKLHAAVLSSASGYFRMLLTTPMDGWCPVCKVAVHVLEGRELEAAPHVLRFIYTQQLPAEDGIADGWLMLIWMLKVGEHIVTYHETGHFGHIPTYSSLTSPHKASWILTIPEVWHLLMPRICKRNLSQGSMYMWPKTPRDAI